MEAFWWARPTVIAFRLRQLTRGFLFIPGILAACGALLAVVLTRIDRIEAVSGLIADIALFEISPAGARAVLGTIAGSMMTVISLVYSLLLVVFSLAAGTISPRLLETFTYNRTNQVTIGLLGATFIYAMIVLYVTGEAQVPRISVAMAIVLAVLSFFWLVNFVHNAASHLIIDSEIGRTDRALLRSVDGILSEADDRGDDVDEQDAIRARADLREVAAAASGYVASIDHNALRDLAARRDGFVLLRVSVGDFVLEGLPVAGVDGELDDELVTEAIVVAASRTPDSDLRFAIHLMVEIALRALSPGTNDSYTAISAIDHLSVSLSRMMERRPPSSIVCDDEGVPRLWRSLIAVDDSIGQALHSIRRGASGNVLVILRLLEAMGRMARVADATYRPLLKRHVRLVVRESRTSVTLPEDGGEIADVAWRVRGYLNA